MGSEKSFDSFLGIETIAETAFGDMDVCLPVNEEDNNYEVTYYNDLVTMFDEISMENAGISMLSSFPARLRILRSAAEAKASLNRAISRKE